MTVKFWVGAGGNWSDDTHWSTSTGGANNTTHAGSSDTATLDGASGGGTVTIDTDITVQSITCGAFTGTLDNSSGNHNVTITGSAGFSGSGSATRTINLGNGTWTLSSATASATPWTMTTTTGLTFNANSSTIDFSGATAGLRTMQSGGLTYNNVKVSGAGSSAVLTIAGGPTINGTLSNTAAIVVNLSATSTVATLTASAQMALVVVQGGTLTITNAPTLTGSSGAPMAILGSSPGGTVSTISVSSGTMSGTWVGIQNVAFAGGGTFSFTNALDLGRNSGATITAPSSGSSGLLYRNAMSGNVG